MLAVPKNESMKIAASPVIVKVFLESEMIGSYIPSWMFIHHPGVLKMQLARETPARTNYRQDMGLRSDVLDKVR